MKKIKRLFLLLLTVVLVLSGCGTSKTSVSSKYDPLINYLEKGQYDNAISWIETLKRNASNPSDNNSWTTSDSNTSSVSHDKDLDIPSIYYSIVGTYNYYNPSDYDDKSEDFEQIKIGNDLTATCDGKSYSIKISNSSENNIYLMLSNTMGNDSFSMSINVYENGVVATNKYIHFESTHQIAEEKLAKLVGTYPKVYDGPSETMTINSDFTVSYDDVTRKILWAVDYEGNVNLYVDNPEIGSYYLSLGTHIRPDGIVVFGDYYYSEDNLIYVDITEDNFFDFFEMTPWHVTNKSYNAFNELTSIVGKKTLRLKAEYEEYLSQTFTKIALEYSFDYKDYWGSTMNWDPETDEIKLVKIVEHPDNNNSNTNILNNLYHDISDNNHCYYFISEYVNCYLNDESTKKLPDGTYEFKASTLNNRCEDSWNFKVVRSNSRLAFVNPEFTKKYAKE